MLKGIYCIFDDAAQRFQTPFFSVQELEAKRQLQFLALDETTLIGRFPSQFKLYRVGHFNDTTGEVAGFGEKPEFICTAIELLGGK